MLNWIKTIMSQNNLQDEGYSVSSIPTTQTFKAYSKDLDKQLQKENRLFYLKKLGELGLKEDTDYDGKEILRSINNEERKLTRGNVKQLLGRLCEKKKNQDSKSKTKKQKVKKEGLM